MRRNLGKIMSLRSLILILSVGFGILISAQLRTIPDRITNPITPYVSLRDTKTDLETEQGQLKNEIKRLLVEIAAVQTEKAGIVLSKDESKALNNKRAQSGLTKLNGPGVIIILDDSKGNLSGEDAIIHAADLRDVIHLLWSSGAEGIAVNNQRVVASTAIDCIVNTILINNVRITAPFQVEAIGDSKLLYDEIRANSLLSDLQKRKTSAGIVFDTAVNGDITLPAYDGLFDINAGIK